jgi:hypothetical protein
MKTTLDADEYFHLALHASSMHDPHACMSYLEGVLEKQPANARALYLRAVQHAELGLGERAVSGIRAALAIDPGLEIARFHLGFLLLLGGGRAAEAKQHLQTLAGGTSRELRAYAQALISVADEGASTQGEALIRILSQSTLDEPPVVAIRRLLETWRTSHE